MAVGYGLYYHLFTEKSYSGRLMMVISEIFTLLLEMCKKGVKISSVMKKGYAKYVY